MWTKRLEKGRFHPSFSMLLPRTGYHVYYEIDRDADIAMIVVVWGARRERGPEL